MESLGADPHIIIQVANGGYVVNAVVQTKDEDGYECYEWTTSVFTSPETMTAYIKRVCDDLIGARDGSSTLGPLKIPKDSK